MTRQRLAAAVLSVVMLVATTAISGCGIMGRGRDTVTTTSALHPSAGAPILPVDAPDANLANSPVVAAAKPSVVKIRGLPTPARRCLKAPVSWSHLIG